MLTSNQEEPVKLTDLISQTPPYLGSPAISHRMPQKSNEQRSASLPEDEVRKTTLLLTENVKSNKKKFKKACSGMNIYYSTFARLNREKGVKFKHGQYAKEWSALSDAKKNSYRQEAKKINEQLAPYLKQSVRRADTVGISGPCK
jgi:SLT domain-containing protein